MKRCVNTREIHKTFLTFDPTSLTNCVLWPAARYFRLHCLSISPRVTGIWAG